ncbi:ribosome-binding ATPase YchF [Holospora obtusa F1]|uniref:Ribosome-binding ATPase YchF n=2 Tax=Holospora obtusa TaxID=49893 RepID=W6TV17_HOLOB|nr:redox-regulated ATPase YchF [Holospora obtusa]ETZ07612.1 ribosome-binding ATPase YchF [Holospora obtusa F1]
MQCGLVGLPNVGKSTLFNALTESNLAQAENYPFCTIEPNIASVNVPDSRLDLLSKAAQSKSIIPSQIQFVDIAGLVKGASKGDGLGNQFLSHIRQVDVVVQVVRAFSKDGIIHVHGAVDPLFDMDVIETELLLADLQSAERQLSKKHKAIESGKDVKHILEQALAYLQSGKLLQSFNWTLQERIILSRLGFLTAKPMIYLINISEQDLMGKTFPYRDAILEHANGKPVVWMSTQVECEIAQLSQDDRSVFLKDLSIDHTGLEHIICQVYRSMGLISFFTVGPKETRSWTVREGAKAPEAAGCIHSDFEKGFIRAEVIFWEDYVAYHGEYGAKTAGRMATEGKDYVVRDGDVMLFRFNV